MRTLQALFLAPWLLLLSGALASAQLELPKGQDKGKPATEEPAGPAGGSIPHLVCKTCGVANYVTSIEPSASDGKQKAWCLKCQNIRFFRRTNPTTGKGGGLDLPAQPVSAPAKTGGSPADPPKPDAQGLPSAIPVVQATQPISAAATQAAASIFSDVRRLKRPALSMLHSAAEGLAALGEAGLLQARIHLGSKDDAELTVATRTLLLGGVAEDSRLVARRVSKALPPRSSKALIEQVIELNPVVASPQWLAGILEHPQKPARTAAYKHLKLLSTSMKGSTEGWLEFLKPLLESKNQDARYKTLDLMSDLTGPGVLHPILEALSDSRARVARKAVDILTGLHDERIDPELQVRAFGSRWILRENAYAVLTIIEREDKYLEPTLHSGHVEALLRAMEMNDAMVQNTAALALAGIGFRMENGRDTAWLDQAVMDRLIGVVAAITFFDDRSSLVEPSLRRLQLLTGRNFGENGPKWAEWWLSNRHTFRASRASMTYTDVDHEAMSIFYANRQTGSAFELLGPERLFRPAEAATHSRYYLTNEQSQDLLRVLEEQGALGADQAPGPRGDRALEGQELVIRIGSGAKAFALGAEVLEPWLQTIAQYLDSLRTQCAWQEFFVESEFVDKRAWVLHVWEGNVIPESEPAKSDWLRNVYLTWTESEPVGKRSKGLDALHERFRDGQGPGLMEFDRLLALLDQERSFGRDTKSLLELCTYASGLEAGDVNSAESALLGERLIGTLMNRFDRSGVASIGELLELIGSERLRLACVDSNALLRAAGGLQVMGKAQEKDWPLLEELMRDPNPVVVTTLLEAAGLQDRQEAMTMALQLSAEAIPAVRKSAMRTLGRLGGDNAREALMIALTEPTGDYRTTAAAALADLGDPKAAPLMVALLRNGRKQGIQESLRRGLLSLGVEAQENLLGALNSPHPFTRREASLLLGMQDVPQSAPALMRLLSEDPTDSEVVDVLVGLTCVDLARADDRDFAWWTWWDSVRQEDSLSWFLATCATRGLPSPQPIHDHFFLPRDRGPSEGGMQSGLSIDGSAFLLQAMRFEETWLAQRAWREWQRRSTIPLGELPIDAKERLYWVNRLAESLSEGR